MSAALFWVFLSVVVTAELLWIVLAVELWCWWTERKERDE